MSVIKESRERGRGIMGGEIHQIGSKGRDRD